MGKRSQVPSLQQFVCILCSNGIKMGPSLSSNLPVTPQQLCAIREDTLEVNFSDLSDTIRRKNGDIYCNLNGLKYVDMHYDNEEQNLIILVHSTANKVQIISYDKDGNKHIKHSQDTYFIHAVDPTGEVVKIVELPYRALKLLICQNGQYTILCEDM